MIKLIETTLQQNYFTFANNIYQPVKGVSMGSPLSGNIAEIFLQHLEQTYLKQIMDNENIIFYARYVDDILIIYNSEHISATDINTYMNRIHPNLTFTSTQELNRTINFLDLLLTRHDNTIDKNIYRKPTTTDTTINYYSNHPLEHKMAAYRFLINKMNSLPLTHNKKNEWNLIKTIAQNNNFPLRLIYNLRKTITKQHLNNMKQQDQKWTTFTYYSPAIRTLTYSNTLT